MSESCATAVQALIDEWNAEVREHGLWTSGHYIAAKMAALLLREGPPQEPPRLRELATMMARRNHGSLGLYGHKTGSNKAAVDTCEHPDCVLVRQPAGLREGPPAPPGHAGDAPATEPVKPCADGHVWSNQFGDDWTPEVGTPCDCREKIWRGSGAVALAASQAGEAPQEAVPDHCENCRAELPVTTVHLCHACLPSAPREHAGEAPATELAHQVLQCLRGIEDPYEDFEGNTTACRFCFASGSSAHHDQCIWRLAASQAGTAPRALMHYRIPHTFRSGCGMTAVNGIHWTTDISYVSCADCQVAAHGAVPPK